jgi:hypothetical protein
MLTLNDIKATSVDLYRLHYNMSEVCGFKYVIYPKSHPVVEIYYKCVDLIFPIPLLIELLLYEYIC